jgi:hypothetical protein
MKKIVRLTENDLIRIVKRVINEQTSVTNNSIMISCAEDLYKINPPEDDPQSTGIPLIDMIGEATFYFDSNDWDEEGIVRALEVGNPNELEKYQNILRCSFKKIGGLPLQENNPLLTIARKTFTTMGMTDFGDKELKMRAQKALFRLGIKIKI